MSEEQNRDNSHTNHLTRSPSAILALVLVAWSLAIGVIWLSLGNLEERFETGVFFGRTHILFLHMPIGLLTGVFALEVLSLIPSLKRFSQAALPMLWLSLLGAVVATLAGFLLMKSDLFEGKFIDRHLWSGLGVVVMTALTLWLKFPGKPKPLYLASLFSTYILLTISSHFGGEMVHGEEYLVEYAPKPIASLLGVKVEEVPDNGKFAMEDRVIYTDIIAPILKEKCNECHNEGKIKGDLRMDSHEMLVKGGDSGPAFVAGNAEDSEIVYRVTVEPDDDDFMPPDGKGDPLTKEEVALLKWWINQGASEGMTVGQGKPDEKTLGILETIFSK
jgi:uncharacterized membrane protein